MRRVHRTTRLRARTWRPPVTRTCKASTLPTRRWRGRSRGGWFQKDRSVCGSIVDLYTVRQPGYRQTPTRLQSKPHPTNAWGGVLPVTPVTPVARLGAPSRRLQRWSVFEPIGGAGQDLRKMRRPRYSAGDVSAGAAAVNMHGAVNIGRRANACSADRSWSEAE